MKIILNKCFGGFGVSEEGVMLYAKKKGIELYQYGQKYQDVLSNMYIKNLKGLVQYYFTKDFGEKAEITDEEYKKYAFDLPSEDRTDETLIEVVEELGSKANTKFSELKVVEIPDGSYYVVEEYDGYESIYYSESEIKEK